MDDGAAEVSLRSKAGRGVVLATVLGSSLTLLDGTVVNVALPHLGRDLDTGIDSLQWVVNGYTLTLAALVLLGGALGDRFGRRRVFLIGVLWFSAASLLCAVAPTAPLLVAARFVQGVGAGLLTPGSLALIQVTIRPQDRSRAIGVWSGLGGVAAAAGPFVGGWLVDALSWRWIFYLNLPLAALTVAAALKWAPESRDPASRGDFDVLGSVLGMVFLGGVTFALIQHRQSIPAAIALALGIAAGALFLLVERRSRNPVLPPSMFAVRQFSAINVSTFFVYAALGGALFFLVMQLQVVSGFSALEAGLSTVPFTLLMLLFSSRAGALGDRIGPRLPLTLGPALSGAGMLLLAGVGPEAVYLTDVLPGVLMFSVGMTLTVAPLTAGVLAAAEPGRAGVASGVNNAVARAASLLAVAALPVAVGLQGEAYEEPATFGSSYQAAMYVCAGVFLAAAAVGAAFVRKPLRAEAPEAVCRTQCPYQAPQLEPELSGEGEVR